MSDRSYLFRVSPYREELLLPQISKALELRTDLLSREQYPGLWSATDKLRGLSGGKTRSKTRSRLMGILCLILGLILFIPGLTNSKELTGPLLIGAFGIFYGILNLWSSRKKKENPFDRSAKLFLESKSGLGAAQGLQVTFDEIGLHFSDENGDPEIVPYEDFECAVEGPDLFLFVFDTRVTVLQKSDLIKGNIVEFRELIREEVSNYVSFP